MELTPTAQSLKEIKDSGNDPEENSKEDTLASCMGSEGFGYALYEGGYLKPEEWLEGEDLKKVQDAVKTVGQFKELVEGLHNEF